VVDALHNEQAWEEVRGGHLLSRPEPPRLNGILAVFQIVALRLNCVLEMGMLAWSWNVRSWRPTPNFGRKMRVPKFLYVLLNLLQRKHQ